MHRSQLAELFRTAVGQSIDVTQLKQLTASIKAAGTRASPETRIALAAELAHAAFMAPDRVAQVYDAITETWLDRVLDAPPVNTLDRPSEVVPAGLWDSFWAIVEDAADGKLDALAITERTAALGGEMSPAFVQRVAEMSYTYPGIKQAAAQDMPSKIELGTLAQQPPGSLGGLFHQLIVENKFDLEVLDRSEIGLSELPVPLAYLNTRILQAHDLWHITAGYETTALHEIALSGFQMAQFGHNYSAQFLAIVAAVGAISPAAGYRVLIDTITTSWAHGRETYPMMLIPWEAVWHKSADEIRALYNIKEYERPYRADLIERTAPIAKLMRQAKALLARFRSTRTHVPG
ncbi:MAG: Coq4 family protein [Hyphomonadaceae bacterium]|nr:Coq4 family protein [Hyphomonadaceae bacterium]